VSSGTNRDFRYYSYRPVPYFGGSDHYQLIIGRTVPKVKPVAD